MRVITILILFLATMGGGHAEDPVPIALQGINHAFRVTDRVLSGSQPEDDAAFASLAREGVKMIVSVDGARPAVATAKKYGLRYVHLPIGYDGIADGRLSELVKAAADAGGPVFVHCHHGRHRGPAAVGVICEATAGWTPEQAEAWLKMAGTGDEYPGLYRAVRRFAMPTKEQMARIGPLPEMTEPPGMVDAMVAIDARFDALDAAREARWKTRPIREATLLWEQFCELARTAHAAERPRAFRKRLADSANAAARLRELLGAGAPDAAELDAAFAAAAESCTACHKAFRNGKR